MSRALDGAVPWSQATVMVAFMLPPTSRTNKQGIDYSSSSSSSSSDEEEDSEDGEGGKAKGRKRPSLLPSTPVFYHDHADDDGDQGAFRRSTITSAPAAIYDAMAGCDLSGGGAGGASVDSNSGAVGGRIGGVSGYWVTFVGEWCDNAISGTGTATFRRSSPQKRCSS